MKLLFKLVVNIFFKGLQNIQFTNVKRISAFIIDETVIQIGSQHFWLWFCIEQIHFCAWNLYFRGEKYACC